VLGPLFCQNTAAISFPPLHCVSSWFLLIARGFPFIRAVSVSVTLDTRTPVLFFLAISIRLYSFPRKPRALSPRSFNQALLNLILFGFFPRDRRLILPSPAINTRTTLLFMLRRNFPLGVTLVFASFPLPLLSRSSSTFLILWSTLLVCGSGLPIVFSFRSNL